jgi:hypothetical protein
MSARDVDHGGDKFAHFSKRTLTSLLPVWCSANRETTRLFVSGVNTNRPKQRNGRNKEGFKWRLL